MGYMSPEEKADIIRLQQEFLARGGTVTKLAPGSSADNASTFNSRVSRRVAKAKGMARSAYTFGLRGEDGTEFEYGPIWAKTEEQAREVLEDAYPDATVLWSRAK